MANEVSILVRIHQVGESILSRISAGLSGIATAAKAVIGAGLAVGGFVLAVQKLAEAGEHHLAAMARFRGSMQGFGFDADATLKKLKSFTHGLLDTSDIMELANKGIVGGGLSVTDLGTALEFATFKARELGEPIAEFSKSLVQALSTGNLRGSVLEAFPALKLEIERLDASGALDSTRKRAEAIGIAFRFMRNELPGLREDLGALPSFAERFAVAIKNALEEAEMKIANSPNVKKFFEDVEHAVTSLVERLPEMLPKIEQVVSGLVRLSEKVAPLFDRLLANLTGTAQDDANKSLVSAIVRTLEVNPTLEGEARERVHKLFRMIAANIEDGGKLLFDSVEQGQAFAKALSLATGTGLDQKAVSFLHPEAFRDDIPKMRVAIDEALIVLQEGQRRMSDAMSGPPAKTGGRRPRLSLLGDGTSLNVEVAAFASAFDKVNTLFASGARSSEQYQEDIEGLVHGLTDLAGVGENQLPDALRVLAGRTSPENLNKLTDALGKARDSMVSLAEPANNASNDFARILAAAEDAAGDLNSQRGLGRFQKAWEYLSKQVKGGLPVDAAISGLQRMKAVGEQVASSLESAFGAAIRGLGEMFSEFLSGGDENFLRSRKDIIAREREVREEFSQGKLTAQQYQEQLSKLAQDRAALNESNNPLRKFAGSMLSTLADLAFSLSTFAFTFGVFKAHLLSHPFGVAAAAFAAGVVLKAAAAKVGGSVGGMRGDIGSSGGGVSGFSGSSSSEADRRPIVFVRIVGTTPGEAARDTMEGVARYQNLGGRAPGVTSSAAVVNVPGVVVRMAG